MATGEEIGKFWAQTQAALSKVDMDAKVEPVESSDPFVMEGGIKTRTASCVVMSSFEGRRIRAWYTVPSGHKPRHNFLSVSGAFH
jgi:cephalosporin-C deacetylase-like acetyl esterase